MGAECRNTLLITTTHSIPMKTGSINHSELQDGRLVDLAFYMEQPAKQLAIQNHRLSFCKLVKT